MKKLGKLNLNGLKKEFSTVSSADKMSLKGGTEQHCGFTWYTVAEMEQMRGSGSWEGGLVLGKGWDFKQFEMSGSTIIFHGADEGYRYYEYMNNITSDGQLTLEELTGMSSLSSGSGSVDTSSIAFKIYDAIQELERNVGLNQVSGLRPFTKTEVTAENGKTVVTIYLHNDTGGWLNAGSKTIE